MTNECRRLPQARSGLDAFYMARDHLYWDRGIPIRDAVRMAWNGMREFITDNQVATIPHPEWDFSRPAIHEICEEYILRDG